MCTAVERGARESVKLTPIILSVWNSLTRTRVHTAAAAAPCCSIKLKNEFMWSRIESFPFRGWVFTFCEAPRRASRKAAYHNNGFVLSCLFVLFLFPPYSRRVSLTVAFFGGVNPILFGSWEAVGEIGGGGFWWATYLIPNMFWQIDSTPICSFCLFFSVVGCFDAVALRLSSRPTALIP